MFIEEEYFKNKEKEKLLTLEWLEIDTKLERVSRELAIIKKDNDLTRQDVKSYVEKNFTDLEATVYIMNVFQGLTLSEIADKLNYSNEHIRKVKANVKNKLRELDT